MSKVLEPAKVEIDPDDYTGEYENYLHEIYGDTIEVCGATLDPVRIYKEFDEVGYNTGLSEFVDNTYGYHKYECPICSETHTDYDDAKTCCQVIRECDNCGIEYTGDFCDICGLIDKEDSETDNCYKDEE